MKRIIIAGLLMIIVVSFPIILWFLEHDNQLKVAIIDKTVPNESYREHFGLTWLLKHMKVTNEDKNVMEASNNYFGFQPNDKKKSYQIRSLPTNYDKYDVIYVADTYGVYEEDLPWIEKSREGSRSKKISGGLEEEEWKVMLDRFNQKKKSLLIAEFNTFASPTVQSVRDSVTDYLGVDWSGWTGRYFAELDPHKNKEIPQWIVDEFADSWTYEGSGFVLVNDLDYEVIVLEKEKHLEKEGIKLSFTKEGREQFNLKDSPNYDYWFDLVTPKNGGTVLANYEWHLTDQGKRLLDQHDIPAQFAAVIANEHGESSSYYFAGDYNDLTDVPHFYQMKGLQQIYKVANRYSDQAFYWATYLPMMKSILEEFEEAPPTKKKEKSSKDLQYQSRIKNDTFEILKNNEWRPLIIKGVNLGMGKPGTFPGEAAITEEEYYRWFEQIGKMNANTIRVYTLHPPGFYHALKRYNDHHEEKIYVLHGVWINEEKLEETLDAFEEKNLHEFQDEMKTIVDVIHGNKVVKQKPGHASGVYRANISEYVIGWILGIEWYPFMVENTNETHRMIGDYNGKYFETKDAAPFEYWLAEQMDMMTTYEMNQYQSIRPMSFTNWPTTDILDHPSDSTGQEDIVSIDPNVIYTKNEANLTAQFASYHIYPYYPDFLNYDQKYLTSKDHRGQHNNYAAYLKELHAAHRLPILVAEFGVPSSRGLTHENPFGWNQGFLSEKDQGEIISHLFEDMMEEQLLGGLVFTWQDEWFKRTWNTMDYDNPDRRPFWSNAQTNEEQFGLLSFDRHKIKIDGEVNDWESSPLYKKEKGLLQALYVDHDERYLYIRLDHDPNSKGDPIILLDVVPEQGNQFMSGKDRIRFSNGIDFLIDLNKKESRMKVDTYYDFYTYQYGHTLKLIDTKPQTPIKNSGHFSPIKYALNKEYFIQDRNMKIPFSAYETGKLRQGNGNPASKAYDSLADYYMSDGGVIEIRIPWLLIQAKDPSKKEFIGDIYKEGIQASTFIDDIYIGVIYLDDEKNISDSFPSIENDVLAEMKGYTWESWNIPEYDERLKRSYQIVKDLFKKYE